MKASNSLKSCIAYIALIQFYNLQGLLGLGSAGRILAIAIIAFSLYKAINVIACYKSDAFIRTINCLLIVFTLYGIYYMAFGPQYIVTQFHSYGIISKFDYLKNIYLSILPFYVIYGYAQKGIFNPRVLLGLALFIIGCSIVSFFAFYTGIDTSNSVNVTDGITNNNGYKFVALIPLLYLTNKWRIPLMILCMVFIILSLKRGAILIGTISFILGLICIFKQAKGFKRFWLVFLIGVIIFTGCYAVSSFYEENAGFQRRVEDTIAGNTSGREDLVGYLWNHFRDNASIVDQLFGNGADSTVGIAGNYAHNDWLEILTNQGVFGVLLFALLFINWFMMWKRFKRICPRNVYYALGVALLVFFLKSIFSMAYTSFGVTTSIIVAYCYYIAQSKGYMRQNNHYASNRLHLRLR